MDAVRALNPTTAASEVDRLGRDLAMDAYRRMVLIRTFEERIFDLFGQGWIRGTSHMCVGQEAVAVGACAGLRPEDQVTSNHRGHGHFLAK
ncbi:MAG TPA: thiamine pyrophosphate-dependent enzyme, partial [Armatimonadota bacterium]|nr:thiamine pyrophosphate-dependent enzyme [Armatimonadota bacterium]